MVRAVVRAQVRLARQQAQVALENPERLPNRQKKTQQ
jgi:hypothetical protein